MNEFMFALAEATAGAEVPEGGGIMAILSQLLFFVPVIVLMYFLIIRPESKRKKQAQKLRDELVVGDEVTMTSGIIGKVVQIKDDCVVVETGEKTRITFVKGAISTRKEKISN